MDFIDSFSERDTRDELGIAVLRDAISERMFPGTTTIQTRARYFLFVPWLLQRTERYAREARSLSDVVRHAREQEFTLMRSLEAGGVKPGEGLFGSSAGNALRRLPSEIYWQGLGRWGIRQFPAGRAQLLRTLAAARSSLRELADEDIPAGSPGAKYWHAGLPQPPKGLLESTNFSLTFEEASYLRDRVLAAAPMSLLARLMSTSRSDVDCGKPWLHPGLSAFSDLQKWELGHAERFSLVVNGAALLYNLMLAEKRNQSGSEAADGWVADYQERLASWAKEAVNAQLADWDLADFWRLIGETGARYSVSTRDFVERWLEVALHDPASIAVRKEARSLIHVRERSLKGSLARLDNEEALRRWNGSSGAQRLDFRWGTVQVIVNDVVHGLASP